MFQQNNDKITSIQPQTELIFTRYLYIKDEVCIALLVSILNKSDDAIFWAYEMYYSGFKNELFTLIWKIYYDFFATLNPTFEVYLLKKQKEWSLIKDCNCNYNKDKIISSIIQALLFRPFNTDVFFLRNICASFENEITYYHGTEKITNLIDLNYNLIQWITNNDFRSIAEWVLNINKGTINIEDIYNICLEIFEKNGLKLTSLQKTTTELTTLKLNIEQNVILLAKIMTLFSKKEQLKKGKPIYINVEAEDIIPYESVSGNKTLKNYQILEKVYICGIDDLKHLSLFKLKRNKYDFKERYLYKWEYHASFSPLWSERIENFGGYSDYTEEKIIFKEEPNDELKQEFYELYGLEPDEQKQVVQNKSIQPIEKVHDWKWFNQKYKKNGLFEIYKEELEEFDVEGLVY